jgi:hypothetical protein
LYAAILADAVDADSALGTILSVMPSVPLSQISTITLKLVPTTAEIKLVELVIVLTT